MKREQLEKPQDRENEALILKALCFYGKDLTWKKLPYSYNADAIIYQDDKPIRLVEVKNRPTLKPVGDYWISALKIEGCRRWARELGLPFCLVVCASGKLRVWKDEGEKLEWKIGGRTDRGDPADLEPMFIIPKDRWKVLPGHVLL